MKKRTENKKGNLERLYEEMLKENDENAKTNEHPKQCPH